jgi:hypothetical protein
MIFEFVGAIFGRSEQQRKVKNHHSQQALFSKSNSRQEANPDVGSAATRSSDTADTDVIPLPMLMNIGWAFFPSLFFMLSSIPDDAQLQEHILRRLLACVSFPSTTMGQGKARRLMCP